jgi:outer membrane protein assembly factor BamB
MNTLLMSKAKVARTRLLVAFFLLSLLLPGCDTSDSVPTPVITPGPDPTVTSLLPSGIHTPGTLPDASVKPNMQGDIVYRGDYARTGVYPQGRQAQRPSNELLWKYGGRFDGCRGPAAPYGGVAFMGCYGDFYALDLRTGKELWKIADLGVNSPPVVVDGLVYFGSVNRHGDDWDIRLAVVDPAKQAVIHEFKTEGEVASSPIVINGTIYFLHWSNLHAIDANTGKEKWKFEKQGVISAGLDDVSPAVGFGLIYFTNVGEQMTGDVVTPEGHLYAVEMQTGKEVWSYETKSASVPVVAEEEGLVLVGTDSTLVALDGRTGTVKWRVGGAYGPPAVHAGVVYAPSGNRDGGILLALDARTGHELWHIDVTDGVRTPPTISGGVIYFGAGPVTLAAVDLSTRQQLWTFKAVDNLAFAPVVADGIVLFGDFDSLYALGSVTAAAGTPTPGINNGSPQDPGGAMFRGNSRHTGVYEAQGAPQLAGPRWQVPLGAVIGSSPAIADGVLYVGSSNGYLNALDADSGSWRWRWKAGGSIVSSPAVVSGTVYFGSLDNYFYALDASSGALKWSFKTGAGIMSSPAVADGAVFFGGMDKQMYALDASTGKELWRFGADASLSTSPAVDKGVVYFGDADGNFHSLDARTGKEIQQDPFWTVEQITSPPSIAGGAAYFGSEDGYLYVLDTSTGKEKWTFKAGKLSYDDQAGIYTSPALHGESVYFGSNAGKVYALDLKTTQQRWVFGTGGAVQSSPAVAAGVVYVGSDDGNLYALDEATGRELWRWKTGGLILSSPVVDGEAVYVGSSDGQLYALQSPGLAARPADVASSALPTAVNAGSSSSDQASPTPAPRSTTVAMYRGGPLHTGYYDTQGISQQPKKLWQFNTVDSVDGTPTYADGILYFASLGGHFYAVDAETGIEKWQFATEEKEEIHSSPAVANGMVYFGSLDGNFYALDATTGKERWRFGAGTRVWSVPTWAGGVVYFGADNGIVYGLDGETGKEVWRFTLAPDIDNSVWGAPSVDEATNTVYIPGRDGLLYAADKATGQEKWHFDTGYMILSSPAVADGVVLFCNWYPSTFALDAATGKLLWQMEGNGSKQDSVAVHEGVAYFGDESQPYLLAVEVKTGKLLWKADLGEEADKSPIIAGGLAYITGFGGGVYGVDIKTGKLAWKYNAGFGLTSPVIANGAIYFGSMGDKVFAIR